MNLLMIYKYLIPVISIAAFTVNGNARTPSLHRNNLCMSALSTHLMQINIRYYRDFPYTSVHDSDIPPGCFVTSGRLRFKSPYPVPIVRCEEQLHLLRSEKTTRAWQLMQKQRGYILLGRVGYGSDNIHAYISSIVNLPFSNRAAKKNCSRAGGKITGIFVRHTMNVRKYTVQDEKSREISAINSTPYHKFYMKNKKSFVSVSQFSSKDILLSYNGNTSVLLCYADRHNNCSKSFHRNKLLSVYNLEVYPHHTYFVGKQRILAHNCCSTKQYGKIGRYHIMWKHRGRWVSGSSYSREYATAYSGQNTPLNTLFHDFFSKDLGQTPFYLGYNRPRALHFGKFRKLSHAFIYRKLDNKVFFLERSYSENNLILMLSTMPLAEAETYNWEFLDRPAEVFHSQSYGPNHLKSVLDQLFLFHGGPLRILFHNCQHFAYHTKHVLTNTGHLKV